MMSAADLIALLPLELLAATSVAVPLAIAVRRSHRGALIVSAVGLCAGLAALPIAAAGGPRVVAEMLVIDGLALLYIGLIAATALVLLLLSYGYLAARNLAREEYYALLPLTTLGAGVLAAASHFASFFLGLELLTLGLLVMIAYHRRRSLTLEAGLKYLILAGVSSASVLFGLALFYFEMGTLQLSLIATAREFSALSWAGLVLVLAGLGFKLALVPFHLWTPDVFQGAPMPVAAFVATVSKSSVVALILRALEPAARTPNIALVLTGLALASMFVGNLLALLQNNVKRLLGYSSVGHMGFLLVALVSGGASGPAVASFYLVAYSVTSLAAFGVLVVLSGGAGDRDVQQVDSLRGLARSRPLLAVVLTLGLLSLAGLPPTAGFLGKLYLMAAGIQAGLWLLLFGLVITSAISLVYYLRVVLAVFRAPEEEVPPVQPAWATVEAVVVSPEEDLVAVSAVRASSPVATLPAPVAETVAAAAARPAPQFAAGLRAERVLLILVTAAVVWIGVYPDPLIRWIGSLLGLVVS